MTLPLHARGESGPVVLWVHGYTLDGTIWEALWDLLPGYRHLAVDLPGHGTAPAATSVDASVNALAETIGSTQPGAVVALSYGGMLALEAAIRAPGSVKRLVLAAPALAGGPVDEESRTCHLDLLRLARERGVGPWLADRWTGVPPRIFAGARRRLNLFAQLYEIVLRHRWTELLSGGGAAANELPRQLDRLRHVRARTTIVIGDEDMESFKRCADMIRRGIPGCERLYVPDAGHLPLLEAPERCAGLLAVALGAPAGR
ncbi:MAG: alpha/beta hydrolase [Candidatus Eremiobacteraeota bacterium]|nr:alpha/beta hydrolase [Candidatus Eremiobacteraeota bacterium]